jgi:hypothetical protein
VGVLPVTSIVTEIGYGAEECAEVIFSGGEVRRVPASEIAAYVSEAENPNNVKAVDSVRVSVPSLEHLRGIRFVDTPGLESILEHNTEASVSWSPNVDLAVVAIAVDHPLSRQDTALIEQLRQYTPNISVLLTKVDTVSPEEQRQVEDFVHSRLQKNFGVAIPVFPYSVKAGYEPLRARFEQEQMLGPLANVRRERQAILTRKLTTLLRSSEDYLRLMLKAADVAAAEREQLRETLLGSRESRADRKLGLRLLAVHAAGKTRSTIDACLQKNVRAELEDRLKDRLRARLPEWRGSFAQLLPLFARWLQDELTAELALLSSAHRSAFSEPLREVERQCRQNLQSFRDRLSEQVMRIFGVPLRTTEAEIEVEPPRAPDVSVGKVFDHSWEIASFLIPMPLVRWAVERRFYTRIEREVYKNLSRLTTQWEERVQAAIFSAAEEAGRRFDELVATVQRLLSEQDRKTQDTITSCLAEVGKTWDGLQ